MVPLAEYVDSSGSAPSKKGEQRGSGGGGKAGASRSPGSFHCPFAPNLVEGEFSESQARVDAREELPEEVGKLAPTSREGRATRVTMSDPGKEAEEMYHYMQFDPYLIKERNEQMRAEASKLRLEKQLRGGGTRYSRLVASIFRLKSVLRPLRRTELVER
jgi:hypothetical protein